MEWWIWLIISVSIMLIIFIVYKLYMRKSRGLKMRKSRGLQQIEKSEEKTINQKNNIDRACERWREENEKSLKAIGIRTNPPYKECEYGDEENDELY